MTNLQILSNTVNEGRVNYTNEFEMKLIQPIDALNREAFFEVSSVSYPATTKNVTGDKCWFQLNLQYTGFMKYDMQWSKNQIYKSLGIFFRDNVLTIESGKFIVPEGIYTLERLLNFLNNSLNEYDIFFTHENNGKIKISANLYVEYWLNQKYNHDLTPHPNGHDGVALNKFHLSVSSNEDKTKKIGISITLNFSKKLSFMLGFNQQRIEFRQRNDNTPLLSTNQSIFADYLPDISDGLDKIFIYCEELERSLVGDTSSEILTSVPIRWSEQGKGNGELIIYSPSFTVKRKFKKTKISSLHITLKDSEGVKIPFDSGSVNIEGTIHYA